MPETRPDFPTLIPPLGDELLADDALDAVAAALPDVPDLTVASEGDEQQPYGMAWQWDFANNRFFRQGGTPVRVHDLNALRIWCETVTNIERGAHPIYDDDIGMDHAYGMIGTLVDDVSAQTSYMQEVFDALMVHDRISNVTNFDFQTDPLEDEAVDVEYEVMTDDGDSVIVNSDVSEA